jgi:hypothetical protein
LIRPAWWYVELESSSNFDIAKIETEWYSALTLLITLLLVLAACQLIQPVPSSVDSATVPSAEELATVTVAAMPDPTAPAAPVVKEPPAAKAGWKKIAYKVETLWIPGPALEGNLLGDATGRNALVLFPPSYEDSAVAYPVDSSAQAVWLCSGSCASVLSLLAQDVRAEDCIHARLIPLPTSAEKLQHFAIYAYGDALLGLRCDKFGMLPKFLVQFRNF